MKTYGYEIKNCSGSFYVGGMSTPLEAKQLCHRYAYENGFYKIESLRKYWFQWWLPKKHSEIDQYLLDYYAKDLK